MKHLLIIVSFFFIGGLAAQTKFETAMEKGLAQLKEAKTAEEMGAVSAYFVRIADAEKDKWLPYYYAAYANHLTGWLNTKADKDQVAGKTKELITKAEVLEKNNSEIFCLKHLVAVQQLTVDAMSRWQTYGAESAKAIAAAKKADPTNPRPYSLEGQYQMNVPESVGGGKAVAKPLLEKAAAMFKTFKPASPFHPTWGEADNAKALAACQ